MRISGFFRLGEIGRMRPKLAGLADGVNGASRAGLGVPGKAARTAWACAAVVPGPGLRGSITTVFSVVPSKFSESSTTLLNASMVVSAKPAWIRVLFHGE